MNETNIPLTVLVWELCIFLTLANIEMARWVLG